MGTHSVWSYFPQYLGGLYYCFQHKVSNYETTVRGGSPCCKQASDCFETFPPVQGFERMFEKLHT